MRLRTSFILICFVLFTDLNAQTARPSYIDGHLYFKYKDGYRFNIKVNENTAVDFSEIPEFSNLFKRYGVTLITRPLYCFNDSKLERIIRLEFTDTANVDMFIKELEMSENIEYAEKIPLPETHSIYNDPFYATTQLNNVQSQWYLQMINASQAWEIQTGLPNIKVAIVDNAIWGAHEDLQISTENLCSFASGVETIGNSAPPAIISQTSECSESDIYSTNNCASYTWSHGTHCAGLAGAINNNNVGISSIGGGVTLMGVRAANDNGILYYTDNGVAWAANNGAKVISMSYGSAYSSSAAMTLFQTLYDNGVILLASAGNSGNGSNAINYPAGYNSVISVASVNYNERLSSFSQRGDGRADIAAPGGYFASENFEIIPDILSTTYGVCQAWRVMGVNCLNNEYYDGMHGTSMACPIVAGLCGLMASAYPEITPEQVKIGLISNSIELAPDSDTISNGAGYINAYASVQYAKSLSKSLFATPIDIEFSGIVGSKSFTVRSNSWVADSWTATSNQTWLNISPSSGYGMGVSTNVDITVQENETSESRIAIVTITQNQETTRVVVVQNGENGTCTTYNEEVLNSDSLVFNQICSNNYSDYYSNIAEKIDLLGIYEIDKIDIGEMLIYSNTTGFIQMKILEANTDGFPENVIWSKNINISDITNTLATYTLPNGTNCFRGGPYTVTLDNPLTVSDDIFIEIDFSQVRGENGAFMIKNAVNDINCENSLYVNYQNNWRLASSLLGSIISAKSTILPHLCTSPLPYIVTNISEIGVTPHSSSEFIEIGSNTSWSISCDCPWITISEIHGNGNSTVMITTTENTDVDRVCSILISNFEENITKTITIRQEKIEEINQGECRDLHRDIVQTTTIYTFQNNEYIFGTNSSGINSYAEYFELATGFYRIPKADFEYTIEDGSVGDVIFYAWANDNGIPGNVIANKRVSATDLIEILGTNSTATYTWEHDTPIIVNGSFFYGIDIGYLSGGFGLASSVINTNEECTSYSNNGSWKNISETVNITAIATAIFPTVCESSEYVLSTTPTTIILGVNEGLQNINVTSNLEWTVSSPIDWIHIHGNTGFGNGAFTFTIDENTTRASRFGTIIISSPHTESITISLLQETESYTISATANIASAGGIVGSGTYFYGESVTISANAFPEYSFTNWTENGTIISDASSYTFVANSGRNLVANFDLNLYSVSVNSNGNGNVCGTGFFTHGSETQISAIPFEHYHFVSWSDGNTQNPRNIIVTENAVYTATFAIDKFNIAVFANGEGYVSGGGTFDYGTNITIQAIPTEGSHFVSWNDMSNNNPKTHTVTSDAVFTAQFAANTVLNYTIWSNAGDGGTISPNGENIVLAGESKSFQITSNDNYIISSVLVDGQEVLSELNNGVYSFQNVSTNHSIEVLFTTSTTIENFETSNISVYPNPSDGNFNIDFNNFEGPVTYQIYDNKGSLIEHKNLKITDSDTKSFSYKLSSGIYYVQVISLMKVYNEKIIIK